MKDSRKHIVLMTATITPENAPDLARIDPAARLRDYEKALLFYLSLVPGTVDGIVFVENSDSDVGTLRAVAERSGVGERVEFLCNYGVHRHSAKGRAYGEFKLLDHAMTHSRMVQEAGAEAVIWKVTGRYITKNLSRMIAGAPISFDAYFDMKDQPMRWMDMRLMAWTPPGYERVFRGVADELDARMNETVMRDYLPQRASGAKLVQRFKNEPLVDGVRGYDNRNYATGRNLMKYYVRGVGRRVAPWYWI